MERSSAGVTADGGKGTVLVNTPTLERWQLVQTTTVAIACTTGVYALLFSRLSGCEGTRGKIGAARIECSNTQRQKHCEEERDHGNRPIAASHGSTPFTLDPFPMSMREPSHHFVEATHGPAYRNGGSYPIRLRLGFAPPST